jgi:hypothetical protein
MSTSITRRGIAVLVAAMFSLFAALAMASQAGAATYYACVKKNGSAHIFTKKPKCKRGESKLSWNSPGPAGRNGLNGASGKNGTNGTNGINGANGKEGVPGPFGEVLPGGKTETGVYGLEGDGSVVQAAWGFPFALATAPTPTLVPFGAAPTAQCPGSISEPKAASGQLCVYEGASHGGNVTVKGIFNPENEKFSASSRFGFGVSLNNGTVGSNVWSQGTWAVTAQ